MFKSTPFRFFVMLSLSVMILTGCKRTEKFTRDGWNSGDGLDFPRRYGMVKDLLQNYKLKGMTYKQAIQLLHEPQRRSFTDRSCLFQINLKMSGVDTIYASNLVLKLSKDSIVTDAFVAEKNYERKKKKN